MATVRVKDHKGAEQGTVELSDAVFAAPINENCVRQALNAYLTNQRQGNAKTKTFGEVSGGGKKPWRQKGTGRARAGSTRSPLWRGGGTIHGPVPHAFHEKVNRKVRRSAICAVLTARNQEEALTVVDLTPEAAGKTKDIEQMLLSLGVLGNAVMIVTEERNDALVRGARNLPGVTITVPENLNVYNLLGHEQLLLTRGAATRVERLFGGQAAQGSES